MADRYDEMTGVQLSAELSERELPITGKVDELRARLREDDALKAQASADGPDGSDEGEETVDVPEPRQPLELKPFTVVLTEDQARALTQGEAQLARFLKHVAPFPARKYCEGDHVVAIADASDTLAAVLPYGVSIQLRPGNFDNED